MTIEAVPKKFLKLHDVNNWVHWMDSDNMKIKFHWHSLGAWRTCTTTQLQVNLVTPFGLKFTEALSKARSLFCCFGVCFEASSETRKLQCSQIGFSNLSFFLLFSQISSHFQKLFFVNAYFLKPFTGTVFSQLSAQESHQNSGRRKFRKIFASMVFPAEKFLF